MIPTKTNDFSPNVVKDVLHESRCDRSKPASTFLTFTNDLDIKSLQSAPGATSVCPHVAPESQTTETTSEKEKKTPQKLKSRDGQSAGDKSASGRTAVKRGGEFGGEERTHLLLRLLL